MAHAIGSVERWLAHGSAGTAAAGLVNLAAERGARTMELNLERTSALFDETIVGPATITVPALVTDLTG